MNRASSATGWVRNPVMISPDLDPRLASSYELGWTYNPITGCLNHINGLCKGGGFPCYAYKLANGRLKQRYLANKHIIGIYPENQSINEAIKTLLDRDIALQDPFYPRFWEERLSSPYTYGRNFSDSGYKMHHHKGIFVCDMSDLFGIDIPNEWTKQVMAVIKGCSQHRFYLLTKQPQNLPQFSPFLENVWVGVTATNQEMAWIASKQLSQIEAGVKFLSIEPLLSWETSTPYTTENIVAGLNGSLGWLIIGACTGTKKEIMNLHKQYPELTPMPWKGALWTLQPKIESLREIVGVVNRAGIPVFLKDNLRPLLIPEDCSKPNYLMEDIFWASEKAQLRQEMPEILYCSTCRVRRIWSRHQKK